MSNYGDIAAGLVTVLQNGIPGLHGFAYPPDSISDFPAAVLVPEPIEPQVALKGNSFTASFRVIVLLASGEASDGWLTLYDYIDPTQANKSVVAAVRADKTLNSKADDADVTRIENIGRRELWGASYYGFDAIVQFVKTVA